MREEPVRIVEEVLRTAAGSAGNQAAAGLRDLAGKHRTQNPILHLGLVMI